MQINLIHSSDYCLSLPKLNFIQLLMQTRQSALKVILLPVSGRCHVMDQKDRRWSLRCRAIVLVFPLHYIIHAERTKAQCSATRGRAICVSFYARLSVCQLRASFLSLSLSLDATLCLCHRLVVSLHAGWGLIQCLLRGG